MQKASREFCRDRLDFVARVEEHCSLILSLIVGEHSASFVCLSLYLLPVFFSSGRLAKFMSVYLFKNQLLILMTVSGFFSSFVGEVGGCRAPCGVLALRPGQGDRSRVPDAGSLGSRPVDRQRPGRFSSLYLHSFTPRPLFFPASFGSSLPLVELSLRVCV